MSQFEDPSSLFEGAPVGYHEIDSTGRIRRVNRAECVMLGYDTRELSGKFVWDLTAPQDRDQFGDSIEQRLSGAAKIESYQGQLVRKDGSPVTIGFYENLIEDECGRITGIRGILINITEREDAMEAILASESKFRQLFDNMMEGVYQSAADGRILTANPALLKMLAYDSEADLGALQYVRPEQKALRMAQLERDGELRNFELELRTRDARQIAVLENSRAVRDLSGAVSYYEGILTDITGRVQAQEALTKERDFTAAIIEGAGSPIVVLRPDGRIIRFNGACQQISGYSFDEVRDRPFWDVLNIPEEVEPLKEIFERLGRRSGPIQHENHWRPRRGELRLIAWSYVPLLDRQGSPAFIIGSGIDITDRRPAEDTLRVSEQRYRDLIADASDIVYTHDLDGVFTSINAAAEKIIGYKRGEVLGMNLSRILAPEDVRRGIRHVYGKLDGGATSTSQCDIIAKDGRRASLQISARLQLRNGKPIGIHGVAREITDRKLAE